MAVGGQVKFCKTAREIAVKLSKVFDFAKAAGAHVIDEATDGDGLGNPRVGAKFLKLVADVFVDVLECVKEGRRNGGGAGAILDARAEVLLGCMHQTAVGVVDDHEFFGAKQMVGDKQGAQRVVGDDAAGITDDVGIACF